MFGIWHNGFLTSIYATEDEARVRESYIQAAWCNTANLVIAPLTTEDYKSFLHTVALADEILQEVIAEEQAKGMM
jgi:phage terminase large subunit-like protein